MSKIIYVSLKNQWYIFFKYSARERGGGNIGTFSWIWGRILGIDMDRPENAYFSIKIV